MSEKETTTLEKQEKGKRKKSHKKFNTIIIIVLVTIIVLGAIGIGFGSIPPKEANVFTDSNLKKIIEVSELSTYECVYNGIATIKNPKDPTKIDYHVAYNAKVKAGIDFEAVDINVNSEEKVISVKIPQVTIHSTNVDFDSMDFIFVNKKANQSGITQDAYNQCQEDVKNETSVTDAIYDLAKKNAENIINALLTPFINQLDESYTIEIM